MLNNLYLSFNNFSMAGYLHVLSGLNYDHILIMADVYICFFIVHVYLYLLIHCLGVYTSICVNTMNMCVNVCLLFK